MNICIGVIGGNNAAPEILSLAEEVGREIARAGATLVCGGRGGVMEAACRGSHSESGLTVGILPGDSRIEANDFVDIPVVTGMGIGRNILVVRSSQAIVAIDGSFGTLSEISYALQLGIPVIGLQTWEVSKDIIRAESAKQAVQKAIELIA